MMKLGSSKMTLAVLTAAAFIVAAGGAAIASNMGFKINKQMFATSQILNAIGDNWSALPYNIPYGTTADLCTQGGFPTAIGFQAQISITNPATNVTQNFLCGGGGPLPMPTNGVGVRVREKGTCTGNPAINCSVCCDTSLAAPFNCNTPPGPPASAFCPAGAVDECVARGTTGPCVTRSHIL